MDNYIIFEEFTKTIIGAIMRAYDLSLEKEMPVHIIPEGFGNCRSEIPIILNAQEGSKNEVCEEAFIRVNLNESLMQLNEELDKKKKKLNEN